MPHSDRLKTNVAILISGRGSNMAALIEAAYAPDYPAKIVLVVSNIEGAGGLAIASANNIDTATVTQNGSKAEFEQKLHAVLTAANAELVCLAGFMKILSADFICKWAGRIINIHPSLLPAFPGLDSHRRAIDAKVAMHGCTVHYVTADVDAGEIIAQSQVNVETTDTEASLAARVLRVEHKLYPEALRMVIKKQAAQTKQKQSAF